jgi:chromosome segregation ATPase
MSVSDVVGALFKRQADRELSAWEYVDEAGDLVAAGKDGKVDMGKLEAMLPAIDWTLTNFKTAVERKKEFIRLQSIGAGKEEAVAQYRELSAQARTTRENNDAEIKRLEAESDEADKAASRALSALDEIRAAERELRRLMDTPAKRADRAELKHAVSAGTTRRRQLDEQIRYLASEIRTMEATTPSDDATRREQIAGKKAELDQLEQELARADAAVAQTTGLVERAEAELIKA